MPKEVEDRLAKEATKKHLIGDRKNAYIFGTMRKLMLLSPTKPKPVKEEEV